MALFTVTNNSGTILLTSFNVSSTTGHACFAPDLSPYNNILYHDGAGAYPTIGDIVYDDSAGVTPTVISSPDHLQMASLAYLQTSATGVMESIACK